MINLIVLLDKFVFHYFNWNIRDFVFFWSQNWILTLSTRVVSALQQTKTLHCGENKINKKTSDILIEVGCYNEVLTIHIL